MDHLKPHLSEGLASEDSHMVSGIFPMAQIAPIILSKQLSLGLWNPFLMVQEGASTCGDKRATSTVLKLTINQSTIQATPNTLLSVAEPLFGCHFW
jgi:hypothetical protein